MKIGFVITILLVALSINHLLNRYVPWIPYSYAQGKSQAEKAQHDSITGLTNLVVHHQQKSGWDSLALARKYREHQLTRDTLRDYAELSVDRLSIIEDLRPQLQSVSDSLRRSKADYLGLNQKSRTERQLLLDTIIDLSNIIIGLRHTLCDTTFALQNERVLRYKADDYAAKMRRYFQEAMIKEADTRKQANSSLTKDKFFDQQHQTGKAFFKKSHAKPEKKARKGQDNPIKFLTLILIGGPLILLCMLLYFRNYTAKQKIRDAAKQSLRRSEKPRTQPPRKKRLPKEMFFKNKDPE